MGGTVVNIAIKRIRGIKWEELLGFSLIMNKENWQTIKNKEIGGKNMNM
jgi:hypothetical protein